MIRCSRAGPLGQDCYITTPPIPLNLAPGKAPCRIISSYVCNPLHLISAIVTEAGNIECEVCRSQLARLEADCANALRPATGRILLDCLAPLPSRVAGLFLRFGAWCPPAGRMEVNDHDGNR